MALFIIANSGKISYGIKQYLCDTIDDIPFEDNGEAIAAGSTVYVVDSKKTYMYNSQGQWVEIITGGGSALSGLSDVDLGQLEDGEYLVYDAESGMWKNGTGKDMYAELQGVLSAGETTVTLTSDYITTNSVIEDFVDDAFDGVEYTSRVIANGSVTYTFPAQSTDMPVMARVWIKGVGTAGVVIEDDETSLNSTWSSTKIAQETEKKVDKTEFADEYDNTSAYSVGDLTIREGKYYINITAIPDPGEEFDPTKWQEVSLSDIFTNVNNKMDKINPTGSGSLSLNRKTGTTVGLNSVAVGNNTTASGGYSYAEGYGTTASNSCSHAEGSGSIASGPVSHAEGNSTQATKECSHAEGSGAIASGSVSHAEGAGTKADGACSHAEGNATKTFGTYSHAEGYSTTASGSSAHAEGDTTTASGDHSHAEGSNTTASVANSHAEGSNTIASASSSHAEGYATMASNSYAHAEGNSTTAYGIGSHAEGNSGRASGNYSHAEGDTTVASGQSSHAEGASTIAAGDNQHVSGKFNIGDNSNTYAEIIGNGTTNNARSNARTLDWSGNEVLAGDLTINGNQSVTQALSGIPKKYKILLSLGNRTLTVTDLETNTTITDITKIIKIIKTCPIEWQVTGLANGHVGRIYDGRLERSGSPEGNALMFQIIATGVYPGTSGTAIPLYIHYTQVYYFDEAQANWIIDDYYYPIQSS